MNMDGSLLFQNAIFNLQSGHLMSWDRQILSDTPLPSAVIDPYTDQEVPDVQLSMRMTFEALSVWIEESKNTNYFSERFVKLSRMIMNGVTSMGRGLVTLHLRGEDLSTAPMSIQDLISAASYQFRKSYLGVLQTVKSHPEISERLLINQIGWNNMLMRLFKTRDKLSKPAVRAQDAASDAQSLPSEKEEKVLSGAGKVRGISEPSAFAEPGAFNAPRAFSSYDGSMKNSAAASSAKRLENGIRAGKTGSLINGSEKNTATAAELKSGNSKEEPAAGNEAKGQQTAGSIIEQSSPVKTNKAENTNRISEGAELNSEMKEIQNSEIADPIETAERSGDFTPDPEPDKSEMIPVESSSRTRDPMDFFRNSGFGDLESFYRNGRACRQGGLSP